MIGKFGKEKMDVRIDDTLAGAGGASGTSRRGAHQKNPAGESSPLANFLQNLLCRFAVLGIVLHVFALSEYGLFIAQNESDLQGRPAAISRRGAHPLRFYERLI